MSNESKPGFPCKVTIGASNNVLGMGTMSIGGASVEELQDMEFGDEHEDIILGVFTGGAFTFAGNFKKDDTQGQDLLWIAFWSRSDISNLRFWIDSVSYYTANTTTAAASNLPAGIPVGKIYVTKEPEVSIDKSGALGQISFSGRVITALRLV